MKRLILALLYGGATVTLLACSNMSAPRNDDATECAQHDSGWTTSSGYVCQ